MHPELLHIGNLTIYTYAFLIVLGTLVASLYTKVQTKKEVDVPEISNNFIYLIFLAGFIGGKLFYYLEHPIYYLKNPERLIENFSGGFVFYGSFITIIPFVIWYLKRYKIPVLPVLDILAITTTIVHSIGRFGCFNAGCCYGKPTDSFLGMVFPSSNHLAVHPTQLYEVAAIISIMVILLFIKKHKQFQGQVFLSYIILYAVARNILELFRGDTRGFIIDRYLSHSQFIGIILILITIFIYHRIKNKQITIKTNNNQTVNL